MQDNYQPLEAAATAAAEAQAKKDKRAAQARINGALSHGPVTPEGKAKSSKNALKHGFAAEVNVLIEHEDSDDWNAHLAGFYDSYRPTNYAERDLVDQLASIRWRQARLATAETAHLAYQIGIQEEKVSEYHPLEHDNAHVHLVLAIAGLARAPFPRRLPADPNVAPDPTQPPDGLDVASMHLLFRYQTALDRQYRTALQSLRQYRKDFAEQAAAEPKSAPKTQQISKRQNEPRIIPISEPKQASPTTNPPAKPVPIVPEVAA